jgi:hypothetical protein
MSVKDPITEPDRTGIQDIRSRGDEASGSAKVFHIVNVWLSPEPVLAAGSRVEIRRRAARV